MEFTPEKMDNIENSLLKIDLTSHRINDTREMIQKTWLLVEKTRLELAMPANQEIFFKKSASLEVII